MFEALSLGKLFYAASCISGRTGEGVRSKVALLVSSRKNVMTPSIEELESAHLKADFRSDSPIAIHESGQSHCHLSRALRC